MASLVIIDGIEYVPRSEASKIDTDPRTLLAKYIKEAEGLTEKHISALKHIVVLINQSEESEKEIIEFVWHIYDKYYQHGFPRDNKGKP